MRSNSQQILSYCLDLHTQKPALRQVDLQTSPERGSGMINMLKQGRNTQKKLSKEETPNRIKLYRTARPHIWIPVLKEVKK